MAKRPTRLRFTEDDLADSHVKKAADRADKAVDLSLIHISEPTRH